MARESTEDRIGTRRDGCPDLRDGTGLHDGDLSHLFLACVLDDEVVLDRALVLDNENDLSGVRRPLLGIVVELCRPKRYGRPRSPPRLSDPSHGG